MASPGILYVTMQPKDSLPLDEFHEWYNNEHGPSRLRLPGVFSNGLRYRASDGAEPQFLAVYDVTSMSELETPVYTSLRERRSAREAETISQVHVNRAFFDLMSSRQAPLFLPIEQLTDEEADGIVLVAVEFTPTDGAEAENEIGRWHEEEHIPMVSRVPGWLRSRRFRTSSIDAGNGKTVLLALHEFTTENGLNGPEMKAAAAPTPWAEEILSKYIARTDRRAFELFYVFAPAPRELSSLTRLPSSRAWVSTDGMTRTTPGSAAAITSVVTMRDGLEIPYRLEGNPSPTAPTLVFTNSLLTSLEMWDPLVEVVKTERPDLRLLRYNSRGRHAVPKPPVPATLDMLADDLAALLSALRIGTVHAHIGVSMGGATTLMFALRYPQRVNRFVACDFNAASSAANTQAWKDRTAVAESRDEDGSSGIKKLAKMTVERWFHPHTLESKQDVSAWMTNMVAQNDVQGLKFSCQALWDYDMKGEMGACQVPGLLVVGEGDGKGALVDAMKGFKDGIGEKGADLKVVPHAGHLPMSENPNGFWEAIGRFL